MVPVRIWAWSAVGEEAQGAFLLEVEGAPRCGRDPAEAAAKVSHGRPDLRFGQHAEAERQGSRADVISALKLERGGDRLQIGLGELPVCRPPRRARLTYAGSSRSIRSSR